MAAEPVSNELIFYLPRDVARILKCSEWWVKEQARRRRIPFCWVGGGYRFTPDHIAEIARLFEHKATPAEVIPIEAHRAQRKRPRRDPSAPTAQLTARPPPRARHAQDTGKPTDT
ncbi:helix-turn-helix domain-containing protein [Jidongwangia harbinensis]|uniref:helix-turn-helix domain-containing protein n=1 Tax=Jidongwangia harbinensis TaxID=2878561 RepID=UPI001CD9A34A|nr:helix-turn-helix domain-containing protein [Jidongwangia harbinensis]MCA2215811.1 helix-turn-helix domain-containing protein [Jidongwangia harbinensis]